MKRLLLALAIGTASLVSFNSCTKEYYEQVPSRTFIYEKTAVKFPWLGTANSAYFTIPISELTQYYIDQGVVSVAISFDDEKNYYSIPTTINGVAFSYEYRVGQITMRAADPIMKPGSSIQVPDNMIIKISLTDADFVE